MPETPHTTFRLSAEGRRLLEKLASHLGMNRTAVMEWLIRQKARALKLVK